MVYFDDFNYYIYMKRNNYNLIVIILSMLFLASADFVFADPAYPFPIEEVQPDGTRVTIQVKGDEYYAWEEDANGYVITKDTQTKEWVYASQTADGSLHPTSYAVGKVMPQTAGMSKGLKDRNYRQKAAQARIARQAPSVSDTLINSASPASFASPAPAAPITKKNLVILVEFSDTKFTYTRENFDDLFNKTGYNVNNALGCVREFFDATTYGKYNIESTVTKIVTADKTSAYYAGSSGSSFVRELVSEVVVKLDSENFNFKQCASDGRNLDALTIIYAGRGQSTGGGADTIWPHAEFVSLGYTTRDGVYIQNYCC